MLASDPRPRGSRNANLLSGIDRIALFHGNLTEVHILYPHPRAVLSGILHGDGLAPSGIRAVVNTHDSSFVLGRQDRFPVGFDIHAVVHLHGSFVQRIFPVAVRRGDEHEAVALHGHAVTAGGYG